MSKLPPREYQQNKVARTILKSIIFFFLGVLACIVFLALVVHLLTN